MVSCYNSSDRLNEESYYSSKLVALQAEVKKQAKD
jgi:hypothetical protein